MNKLIFLAIITFAFVITSCGNKDNTQSEEVAIPASSMDNPASAEGNETSKQAKIEFVKTTHDFGTIVDGTKVNYAFKFTNTGDADLRFTNVRATCGCTVADYPKTPIEPGKSGKIKVSFDSSKRIGQNFKQVTVMTNTVPSTTVLTIQAEVVK